MLNPNDLTPIYVQLAQWLETEILAQRFKEDDKVFSQYQLAEMFLINPATAAKGINLLAEEGILYKKRGLGMFVSKEARVIILKKRQNQLVEKYVKNLIVEAKSLNLSKEEVVLLIDNAFKEDK